MAFVAVLQLFIKAYMKRANGCWQHFCLQGTAARDACTCFLVA